MFSWLLGTAPAKSAVQSKTPAPNVAVTKVVRDEVPPPPQDSAPMFAVNAFKTAVFGTPAPAKAAPGSIASARNGENPPPQPIFKISSDAKEAPTKGIESNGAKRRALASRSSNFSTRQNDGANLFGGPSSGNSANKGDFTFKVTNRKTIFDKGGNTVEDPVPANLFEATPARPAPRNPFDPSGNRPASPTKSILVPRGGAPSVGPKKAVSFHPSLANGTPESKNSRVRSGLPHEFPGKFPSPWTPRTGQTPRLGGRQSVPSLDDIARPVLQPTGSKRSFDTIDVTEDSRIEDVVNDREATNFLLNTDEADVTTDMDKPRSASGQFWKNHSKSIEDLALNKVDKLKERCHTAIEYAKKKDELCASLAEKLRETLDKNKLLKEELKRINRWSHPDAHKDESVLAEAMDLLAEKESKLYAAEEEMAKMQELINQYSAKAKKFEELLDHREDMITELSMSLYDGDLQGDPEDQVKDLKQKLQKARNEAKEVGPLRLQCTTLQSTVNSLKREKTRLETRLATVNAPENGNYGSTSSILKPDVEARLKARIEELERSKRDLQTEMRTKISEASKARREAERALRSEISDLKAKLVNEQLDKKELQDQIDQLHAELLGLGKKDAPSLEWQQKHRSTLEELRRVKEELDQLKLQHNSEHLFRLNEGASQAFLEPNQPDQKEAPVSSSDDSAIDRNFDRQEARKLQNRSRSRSPRKSTSERVERRPSPPRYNAADPFDLQLSPSPYKPTADKGHPAPPPKLDFNFNSNAGSTTPSKFAGNESWVPSKPSPRPSVVNWSPPKKRASTIARRNPTASALDSMDPERKAAAERRIAERKAARRAAGLS